MGDSTKGEGKIFAKSKSRDLTPSFPLALIALLSWLIKIVHCRYGSSRKFSGRSVISSISSEANRNYEYSEFKTDKIVAEEYVKKLVGKTQYFKPEIIEADIYCEEKVLDGENPEECKNITSKDKTVAKILEYVYLKIDKLEKKEQFENIILPKNNCNIGFPLPKNIFGKAFLFDSALNFSGDDLEELIHGQEKMVYVKPKKEEEEDKDEKEEDTNVDDDEDDEEGNVQLSTLALLEAIYKGSKGFGNEDIFLDWEKIPEKEYKYEIGKRHRIKDIAKGIFLKVEKILRKLIKSIENKINKIKRKEKIKSWFKYPFSIFKSTSSTISIPKEEIAKEEKVNSPLLSDRKETEVQEHTEEIHSSDIRRSPFLKKDLKPLRSFNEGTSLETGKKESTHKRYRSADDIIQVFQSPKINDYTTSNDDINEVYETDDFDKDEFEDKDIKGIRKLEKTGKANIDEKLKLEINERIKSIKQKWLNELKLLKTIKEREDKIKEWKEILDNWEKKARDIFEEKIIIIKDDAGHKILTEQKVHPFKFLQEVIFEVSIKPTDKRFKKITVEEYEEVIEFLENTEKFIIWPPKKNNESKEKNNFDKSNEGEELVEIKGESSNSNIKEINKKKKK
ncbi:hypothetical protein Mgra_00002741 [Meloidogyne graminicola]|uniref:Uncharacterized protein n=1 Tax=Meloidogyne graminicola TaxID=189291 RepID=A0A8S9ZWS7_9BILA|nr:hypothetical protein Mgra_00002741 [Meloidogyne graminicola]